MGSCTVTWQGEFDRELQYTNNYSRKPNRWNEDMETEEAKVLIVLSISKSVNSSCMIFQP